MTAAFAIHEASQVGAARRHALSLAEDLGFTENRAGHVGLIASELASNLVKHARDGMVLVRALHDQPAGVEIVSIDRGPGMDSARALRDGYSTAASLGHGLGAIKRHPAMSQDGHRSGRHRGGCADLGDSAEAHGDSVSPGRRQRGAPWRDPLRRRLEPSA